MDISAVFSAPLSLKSPPPLLSLDILELVRVNRLVIFVFRKIQEINQSF